MSRLDRIEAREDVIRAVLRILTSERVDPHAHSDADAEYADDQLVEAARRFVEQAMSR